MGDQKTINWYAAMLLRSRFLAYSRPSSTSDFCSNGPVESVASGSSGGLEARVETEGDGPTEMERDRVHCSIIPCSLWLKEYARSEQSKSSNPLLQNYTEAIVLAETSVFTIIARYVVPRPTRSLTAHRTFRLDPLDLATTHPLTTRSLVYATKEYDGWFNDDIRDRKSQATAALFTK